MGKLAVENTPLGRNRKIAPGNMEPDPVGYNVRGGYPEGAPGVPKVDNYHDEAEAAQPVPVPGHNGSAPFKVGGK